MTLSKYHGGTKLPRTLHRGGTKPEATTTPITSARGRRGARFTMGRRSPRSTTKTTLRKRWGGSEAVRSATPDHGGLGAGPGC
jgi:hypothetical protein